ncbi:MAG TPA: hypothetical protein DEQ30_04885 [Porphyromonadaceae bacterium]|nr:hypothetical protein [Porphyromonadaceae bacterium]
MNLSKRENQVLALHAVGLTPDEISDHLSVTRETARTTIRNIKSKLNWHKASELTAYWWCNQFNVDFIEKRKQILSASLSLIILIAGSLFECRRVRTRQMILRRTYEIERQYEIEA